MSEATGSDINSAVSTRDVPSKEPAAPSGRVEIDAIKRAAVGRWPEILLSLTGIPAELLDGKHHPCPGCGGTDRFRALDDFYDTGAVFCNQCFSEKNGDGFAAVQHFAGVTFPTALRMVADHLGTGAANENGKQNAAIGHGKRMPKKAADEAMSTKGVERINAAHEVGLLDQYCRAKPPITPEGIVKCGGSVVTWNGRKCLRMDGFQTADDTSPSAVVLLQIDGKPFPAYRNVSERKSHSVKGSINSWISSGDVTSAETILDVEGVTDLLAVASQLPAGWVAVTNTAGAKARGKLPRPWATGKRIIVAGDADAAGEEGKRRSALAYHEAGAREVFYAQLPFGVVNDHGQDLRDWLNDGGKLTELPVVQAKLEDSNPETQHDGPSVIIDTNETRVIDEAIAILAGDGNIYQRGGFLVHVTEGADPPKGISRAKDAPCVALVTNPRIRELLAAGAPWVRLARGGEFQRVHPPEWVIKGIVARGQWQGINRLESVAEIPVLRADGTVLQSPGYDSLTGLIFRPQIEFPTVADKPSKSDAQVALKTLLEVAVDMPFASEAHQAAWIAAVLTPPSRYAFHGPAPLFLIDANVRGCGKSLLTDCISEITAGREMARMSLPRDDEEFRKRITALAIAAEPLILIDNITGTLGSASLDAALTATSWSDRILGATRMASNIPLYATWYATGNNVILAADTSRRTLHIRLESPEENPEERQGFQHPELLAWIRQNRARLAVAPVTILSAYFAAGRPNMRLKPWGSYEAWSALVRSAVVWVGLPDPAETRVELSRQSDREAVALRQLLSGWTEMDPSGAGMTTVEVIRLLDENPRDYQGVRGALWDLCPPRDGKILNTRSVGMKLHHLRRRVIGGYYLDSRNSKHGSVWTVSKGDTRATGDTTFPYFSNANANSDANADRLANVSPAATGNSVTSPSSPTAPADCPHTDLEQTRTHDGYVNRQCRACKTWLPCFKAQEASK